MNTRQQQLFTICITANVPTGGGFAAVLVKRLKTKLHGAFFGPRWLRRQIIRGLAHFIPVSAFWTATSIERLSDRCKRNIRMPCNGNRLAVFGIRFKINHIGFAV